MDLHVPAAGVEEGAGPGEERAGLHVDLDALVHLGAQTQPARIIVRPLVTARNDVSATVLVIEMIDSEQEVEHPGSVWPRRQALPYAVILMEPLRLLARVDVHEHADRELEGDAEVAAWFIYLNKTGYNGLYRVNRKNRFNVPFGSYVKPNICDETNLRRCAKLLKQTKIDVGDFEQSARRARKGDLVYFDPPYVPLSATSSFTSYTSDGFGIKQQERLRDLAVALKKRGVHVLISNSSAGAVRELYRDNFEIISISARRAINCKAQGRGNVKEYLIR